MFPLRQEWPGAGWALIALIAGFLSLNASGCAAGNSSNGGEQATRLQGGEHSGVDLSRTAPAQPDHVIELELGFALRNKAQFDELMRQTEDRSSKQYHHWLTPEEMHKRFGESQAEFNAVEQWLTSQGFTITEKGYGQNEDYIRFKGTVDQVQKAFKVRLFSPSYDRYTTNDDPAIPPQFVGVVSTVTGFAGLLH